MRLSWSDRRFRGLVWQVLVVGSAVALAFWLWRNTVTNLDARHIATGFAFLKREAGMRDIAAVLTRRELAVARMIAKGMHNKAVATKMAVTEGTVKLHLHHAYEKLGVDGRIGLIQYLQRRGLD